MNTIIFKDYSVRKKLKIRLLVCGRDIWPGWSKAQLLKRSAGKVKPGCYFIRVRTKPFRSLVKEILS